MKDILGLLVLPFALVIVVLGFIVIMVDTFAKMLFNKSEKINRHCKQVEYTGGIKMKHNDIKITTPNEPTHVTVTTPNEPMRVTVSTAIHSNEKCPSYDCGMCSTFPAPYEVQCGGEETKKCIWLDYDFDHFSYTEGTPCK